MVGEVVYFQAGDIVCVCGGVHTVVMHGNEDIRVGFLGNLHPVEEHQLFLLVIQLIG